MDVDTLFAGSQDAIKTCTELSNADKLNLYALYKQATVGPATGERPGRFDPINRAKWDSWSTLGSMEQTEAKQKYCALVDNFVPGWQDGLVQKAPSDKTEPIEPSDRGRASSIATKSPGRKRKWIWSWMKPFVEESLDDDDTTFQGGDFLHAAHSIVDKLLLLCVLDEKVRPLYAQSTSDLPRLKGDLVGAILAALRADDKMSSEPVSLDSHRHLSQDRIDRLRIHLSTAVKEYGATDAASPLSTKEMEARLLRAPDLPMALLPRGQEAENVAQAAALRAKGATAATNVLGGIEFAPFFSVPLHRRRQMFACTVCSTLIFECAVLTLMCMYYWRLSWPFMLPYAAWIFWDKSPWKGGMRPSSWLRRSWFFRNWAEYFPASLIKAKPESDFSGKRPILMGYHPHGILSFGALCNVGTDTTGWSKKFPNVTPRLCTLNMNFYFPFLREIIGRLGCISASAPSIKAALKPGNAVVLVVGGAAEALDTKSGQYVLTLARRTGFYKLALQSGADLVPSFGFGENDIFETVEPKGILRQLQLKAYKALSFSIPLFYGRTMFTYNVGWLPYRRPLTLVVGEPIHVEKTPNPTKEQIEDVKAKYIEALRHLFEEWQPRLEPGREGKLIIT